MKCAGTDPRHLLQSSLTVYDNYQNFWTTTYRFLDVHIRPGVVWTRQDTFIGTVPLRLTLTHFVIREPELRAIELAPMVEVFIISVLHYKILHVVHVVPCAENMSCVDYLTVL